MSRINVARRRQKQKVGFLKIGQIFVDPRLVAASLVAFRDNNGSSSRFVETDPSVSKQSRGNEGSRSSRLILLYTDFM